MVTLTFFIVGNFMNFYSNITVLRIKNLIKGGEKILNKNSLFYLSMGILIWLGCGNDLSLLGGQHLTHN